VRSATASSLMASTTFAGVDHRCEMYPEALHGWTMADFAVQSEAAAERHRDELLALFADTLTRGGETEVSGVENRLGS
jgi:carboxymethylenebutenolidase